MAGLVCWSCGGSLHGVPRPIRRLTQCPHCRAALHVCRGCRHWDPKVLGECRHERAERVEDKTSANFCTHFRPRPDAHGEPFDAEVERARAALDELFGAPEDAKEGEDHAPVDTAKQAREQVERSQRELRALFDLPDAEAADGAGEETPEGGEPDR